jgi:hypothetical protein
VFRHRATRQLCSSRRLDIATPACPAKCERPMSPEQTAELDDDGPHPKRPVIVPSASAGAGSPRARSAPPPQTRSRARSTTTMTKIATDIKTYPRPVGPLCHQRLRSTPRSWHAAGRSFSQRTQLEKETTRSLRDGQSRCRRLRSYSQAPRATMITITPPMILTTLPCAVARTAKPSTPSEITQNDAHQLLFPVLR